MSMRETLEEECARYDAIEAARAEGIAAERAAVVADMREQNGWMRASIGRYERGDHHPAHATALTDALAAAEERGRQRGYIEACDNAKAMAQYDTDALDRARAEGVAACVRAYERWRGEDEPSPAELLDAAMRCDGADALKRMLAAAKEEGRNEMRREKEQLVTYTASEVVRREREAGAAALERARDDTERWVGRQDVSIANVRAWLDAMAAALRAAGEGGGE